MALQFPSPPFSHSQRSTATMSTTDPYQEPFHPLTPPISTATTTASPARSPNTSLPNPLPLAFLHTNPRTRKKPDFTDVSKTTPPCTECGRRFSSWKARFGHMRWHPECQWRGINPPRHFRRLPGPFQSGAHFSAEEYDVASSLIMMANGPSRDNAVGIGRRRIGGQNCLKEGEEGGSRKRRWEEIGLMAKAGWDHHKCSVCARGFSSGQELGGHMRSHWEKGEENIFGNIPSSSSSSSFKKYVLDLNVPPPGESDEGCLSPVLDLKLGMS